MIASASVGVNVGLNLQNQASFDPTVNYGYYSWINTTGTLGASDNLTFASVQNGGLAYLFPQNLELQTGTPDFFLNFLPAVQMDMPVNASATVTIPLTGNFHAEAFGDTLVDQNIDLANLYSETINYDTWDDQVTWGGQGYYNLHLHENNAQCQLDPSPTCEVYDVIGEPILVSQSLVPSNSTSDFSGDGHGDWNSGVQNAPRLPNACDPRTGICYASDDPNMPIGPGSVSFHLSAVPEPETWVLMLSGFVFAGAALRRGRPAPQRRVPLAKTEVSIPV